MLVGEDLAALRTVALREVVGAGEPLNPEVIERVRRAWGLTIRDGYGQTETTAQVGNSPGQPVKPGSMGRPLPGYRVALLDEHGKRGGRGRDRPLARSSTTRPHGRLSGRRVPRQPTRSRGGCYRTGDVRRRDADGYITYVGRADDVFKSSDYRISPFELEARSSSIRTSRRRPWCPAPTRSGSASPRRSSRAVGMCAPLASSPCAVPLSPRTVTPLQADPLHRVRRAPQDDLGEDQAGRASKVGGRPTKGWRAGSHGVLGSGFPGALTARRPTRLSRGGAGGQGRQRRRA